MSGFNIGAPETGTVKRESKPKSKFNRKIEPGGCVALVVLACIAAVAVMGTIKIGLVWFA